MLKNRLMAEYKPIEALIDHTKEYVQFFDPGTLANKAVPSFTGWIGQRLFAKKVAKRKSLF
jgi:hypothetical protein